MKALYLAAILALAGCATSPYTQVADEVPHYGLSSIKVPTGVCYIYVEKNNGVSLFCPK